MGKVTERRKAGTGPVGRLDMGKVTERRKAGMGPVGRLEMGKVASTTTLCRSQLYSPQSGTMHLASEQCPERRDVDHVPWEGKGDGDI
jgi:hypothetical protein